MAQVFNRLVERLSRVTSSGSFIPEIDGLRFYAITPVVLFHINDLLRTVHPELLRVSAYTIMDRAMLCGTFGVELFFVISGLILSLPFAFHLLKADRAHPSLKSYYLRRVTRLEPPYIISLLCLFALKTLVAHKYAAAQLAPNLFASLFYVHNIVYGVPSLVSIVTWSLEVEVQFYILAPLLVQLFRIPDRTLRLLALCAAPSLVTCLAHTLHIPVSRMNVLGNLQYFMAGMVLTDIYILSLTRKFSKTFLWDLLGLFAWVAIGITLFRNGWMRLLPLYIVVAYVAAFRGVISSKIARNPVLTTIGGMCYTTYLFHNIVLQGIGPAVYSFGGANLNWCYLLLESLAIYAVIIAACAMLFTYIEKPFMYKDWPAKLARRAGQFLRQSS